MPTTAMCLLVSQNGQLLVAVVADDQPMTELLTATATQSLAVLIAGDDSIARAASAAAGAARRRRRRASSPAAAAAAPPPGLGRGGSLQSLRFPLRFRLCHHDQNRRRNGHKCMGISATASVLIMKYLARQV
jgi:hypothetical protein